MDFSPQLRFYVVMIIGVAAGGVFGERLEPMHGGFVGSMVGTTAAWYWALASRPEWGTQYGFKPMGLVATTASALTCTAATIAAKLWGIWWAFAPLPLIVLIAELMWRHYRGLEDEREAAFRQSQT